MTCLSEYEVQYDILAGFFFFTVLIKQDTIFPRRRSHLAYQSFPPQYGSCFISISLTALLPPPEHLNKMCAHFFYLYLFIDCLPVYKYLPLPIHQLYELALRVWLVWLHLFSLPDNLPEMGENILRSWSHVVCVGVIFHSIFYLTGFLTVVMETQRQRDPSHGNTLLKWNFVI